MEEPEQHLSHQQTSEEIHEHEPDTKKVEDEPKMEKAEKPEEEPVAEPKHHRGKARVAKKAVPQESEDEHAMTNSPVPEVTKESTKENSNDEEKPISKENEKTLSQNDSDTKHILVSEAEAKSKEQEEEKEAPQVVPSQETPFEPLPKHSKHPRRNREVIQTENLPQSEDIHNLPKRSPRLMGRGPIPA